MSLPGDRRAETEPDSNSRKAVEPEATSPNSSGWWNSPAVEAFADGMLGGGDDRVP